MKTLIILSIILTYISIGCFVAALVLNLAKRNFYPLHEDEEDAPVDVVEEAIWYGIFWPFIIGAMFFKYSIFILYPLCILKEKIELEFKSK